MRSVVQMPISDIVIAGRFRKEFQNVDALANSMQRIGQLQPVVLNTRNELIAGERRIRAALSLGWSHVSAVVLDNLDDAILALIAERDENTNREPLAPSEMVEIGKRLESLERPKAAERKAASQPKKGVKVGQQGEGNFPPPSNKGKTVDKVGAALGISGKTYEKAKRVVEAAESQPDTFGDLPAKMDATGKVETVYRELKSRKESTSATDDPLTNRPMKQWASAMSFALSMLNVRVADIKRLSKTPSSERKAGLIRVVTARIEEIVDNLNSFARELESENVVESEGERQIIGKGVFLAHEAINHLTRIPKNDALRERGLEIVMDWCRRSRQC